MIDLGKIYDDMRNMAIPNLIAFIPLLVMEMEAEVKDTDGEGER